MLIYRKAARNRAWLIAIAVLCTTAAVFVTCTQARGDEPTKEATIDEAIATIKRLGGITSRDGKLPGNPIILLDLRDSDVTDTDLKRLSALRQLRYLRLEYTNISDVGLKSVITFQDLQGLGLDYTGITEVGVKELASLKHLRFLCLGGHNVSDAWLESLATLTQLQMLLMGDTNLTKQGIRKMEKALPNCEVRNFIR